jgi:competence protein ComEC
MTILWLVSGWVAGLAAFLGLLISASAARRAAPVRPTRRVGRVAFACAICFALGGLRMVGAAHIPTPADLDYYNNQGLVTLEGVIDDAPMPTDSGLRFRVAVETMAPFGQSRPVEAVLGVALVEIAPATAGRFDPIRYGDRVRLTGEPQSPSDFGGGRYRLALARSGIYTTIYRPGLTVLAHDQGSPFLAASFALRDTLYDRFLALIPMPQAALLSGIVLGVDQGLPREVQGAFQATGTSHIVAISGANISVVAGLLLLLVGGIRPRWFGTLILIGALAAYTIFVGASPSVVRAALMAALSLIAQRTGRRGWAVATLALTVLIQSLISPLVIYDAGFALSALATLGILIYLPLFESFSRAASAWLRPRWLARGTAALLAGVSINLAVQVTTLPVQLALAGNASPLAVIVNALVVPAQPAIMILGLLCAAGALIWLPIAQVAAWFAYLPTAYSLWIIRRGADLIGTLPGITLEPGALVVYYAALLYLTGSAMATRSKEQGRRLSVRALWPLVRVGGAGAALLVWGAAFSLPDQQVHLWLLPIGDPGAALIRTPQGGTILVDGGPSASKLASALGDTLPFLQTHIDLLILTAPTAPKSYAGLSGLAGIDARYAIGQVAVLGGPPAGTDPGDSVTRAFAALRQALGDVPWLTVQPGDTIRTADNLLIRFGGAPEDGAAALHIRYGQAVMALPIAARPALFAVGVDGQVALQTPEGGKFPAGDPPSCTAAAPASGAPRYSYRAFACPLLEIRTDGRVMTITR